MSGMSNVMTLMQNAARKASRNLLRDFNEVEHLQVARKGPADFVSRADKKAEETIVQVLSEARPGYGFLLEEGGAAAQIVACVLPNEIFFKTACSQLASRFWGVRVMQNF